MSKSHSSIFSFDTVKIESFPKRFWYSILLCVICLAILETISRILLAPIGNFAWRYWAPEAIDKFEWYREISNNGNTPDVLVIGDSTAARNFDPASFFETTAKRSYNMAWPANFPRALRVTTYPLLQRGSPPHAVILIQNPGSYIDTPRIIRFENSILSSQIAKSYTQSYLISDFVYLARLYEARNLLKRHWIDNKKVVSEPAFLGFMPARGPGTKAVTAKKKETVNTYELVEFSLERLETFRELAALLKKREILLIVVIPPTNLSRIPPVFKKYKKWLQTQSLEFSFALWDYSSSDFLEAEHFYDKGHLNESGAHIFSSEIGRRYKKASSQKNRNEESFEQLSQKNK